MNGITASLFDSQTPQSYFYILSFLFELFTVQDIPPNTNSLKSGIGKDSKAEISSNKYAHPVDVSALETNPTVSE